MSETKLMTKITAILRSSKLPQLAKGFSKEFNSRASTPFEEVLHVIEHTARHRSDQFHSDRSQLLLEGNLLTMILFPHNIDVLALVLISIAILAFSLATLFYFVLYLHVRFFTLLSHRFFPSETPSRTRKVHFEDERRSDCRNKRRSG